MKSQKEYGNLDNQKIKKQKNNILNFDFLSEERKDYILLSEELNAILDIPKLSKKIFNIILDDKTLNKLSVGDILEKYENFTKIQLIKIRRYIHSHLYDKNPLFVSDLIDCANWNNIESDIIFDFCINAIKKYRTSPIVLSAITYVFEHMKISQSVVVVPIFDRLLNNKTYYQDCQIIASFCLFRITMNPKYLQVIKELTILDNELHNVLINKMLHMDYNKKNCFFYQKDDFI